MTTDELDFIFTKEYLQKKHIEEGTSIAQIARDHGCYAASVAIRMSKHNLKANSNRNTSKTFKGYGNISLTYWKDLQAGAVERNIEFNITIEEAWELFLEQKDLCVLSGLPITVERNISKIRQTASLDRIDSSKGYIRGNIQWVHKDIQRIKNNLPEDRFLFLCDKIAKKGEDEQNN